MADAEAAMALLPDRVGGSSGQGVVLALDRASAAAIADGMRVVLLDARAARHLRGDIYEVRVGTREHAYRVLFSAEASGGHVLLAVSAFEKKTRRTPPDEIDLAEARLKDWRRRGR